ASSAVNTPVDATRAWMRGGSAASRTCLNLVRAGGFEEAGDDIGLGQASLGCGGAEAGVGSEAGVGIDPEDIGPVPPINPEIDAGIAVQTEQVPGGPGE